MKKSKKIRTLKLILIQLFVALNFLVIPCIALNNPLNFVDEVAVNSDLTNIGLWQRITPIRTHSNHVPHEHPGIFIISEQFHKLSTTNILKTTTYSMIPFFILTYIIFALLVYLYYSKILKQKRPIYYFLVSPFIMPSKKSQIKMMETMGVIVVFFFLIMFGYNFYVKIQESSFARQAQRNRALKAIQLAQKSSFLPELQCSFKNVQVENCLDLLKVNAFYNNITINSSSGRSDYYDVFGYANITLNEVYPNNTRWFEIYTVKPNRVDYQLRSFIPVSMYNSTTKSFGFGILYVDYYEGSF